MNHPVRLLRRRDDKERAIDIAYEQERINKDMLIRFNKETEKLLKSYQEWKESNSVEGIRYLLPL